jgi:hypothetical protein
MCLMKKKVCLVVVFDLETKETVRTLSFVNRECGGAKIMITKLLMVSNCLSPISRLIQVLCDSACDF